MNKKTHIILGTLIILSGLFHTYDTYRDRRTSAQHLVESSEEWASKLEKQATSATSDESQKFLNDMSELHKDLSKNLGALATPYAKNKYSLSIYRGLFSIALTISGLLLIFAKPVGALLFFPCAIGLMIFDLVVRSHFATETPFITHTNTYLSIFLDTIRDNPAFLLNLLILVALIFWDKSSLKSPKKV